MFLISVEGIPATQGSKTLYRGRMVESSKKLPAWRSAIILECKTEMLRQQSLFQFDQPVKVWLTFFLPRPAKSKWGIVPAGKPDLDKLIRGVLDPLVIAGVLKDDSLVVEIVARKMWTSDDTRPFPGVTVQIANYHNPINAVSVVA
jgi:crossover junction endodeoxyribonuclease RusA